MLFIFQSYCFRKRTRHSHTAGKFTRDTGYGAWGMITNSLLDIYLFSKGHSSAGKQSLVYSDIITEKAIALNITQ